jgi:hypothetical protein
MSYMDYNGSYNSCGYASSYGGGPDYPYRLDQSITSDSAAVVAAINGLVLGWGNDGPQDYTRIFYESYADPAVGWRPGAKRILVNFGDNVPHDCNLNEGVTSGTWTTGGDPGRDTVMGTADDLDLQTVLAGMAANGVVLIECHTTSYANAHWDYWTGITGGDVYITTSSTLVDDVVNAILTALITPKVYGLHLEASTGFESWLVSVLPPSYDEVEPCNTVTFTLTIHVPLGTEAGEYTFTISAVDEDGVSYGDQTVTITVITEIEVPVDIKPTSCPNPLNVSSPRGVLPAAIVGTEDFNVKKVDQGTIKLEGVSPLRYNYEDVCTPYYPLVGKNTKFYCTEEGPDGFLDLTLKFLKREIVDALGEVEDGDEIVLELTGELYDGTPIIGEDVVIILKKGK